MCLTCLLTKYFQDNISPLVKVATVKMVDKFSFPSGHATRATMLALLFTFLSPLPLLLWCDMINNFTSFTVQLKTADTPPEYYLCLQPTALLRLPFFAWALAVAVSRVLLGRHHILDVVAGVVIGVLEAVLLSMLWRSEEEVAFETSNVEHKQELLNFTGKCFGQLSAWI